MQLQAMVLILAILLFGVKLTAWFLTSSLSILTDALESIANIIAGGVGFFSLLIAAKPRDKGHPYGHGKVEFISAAAEGMFILFAGIFIIVEAISKLFEPQVLSRLNVGIIMMGGTAIINYMAGSYCVKEGRKGKSIQLIAAGEHLKTDTLSTLAIIAGLVLIYFTKIYFLDSLVAIIAACFIIYTGIKVLRPSIGGIMDESDMKLLGRIVKVLNEKRNENWIDLHNVRFIKYGTTLHCDCHLTVPWYLNIREAHQEITLLKDVIQQEFGTEVEMFVHVDPCLDYSCRICSKQNCAVRKHPQETRITWTVENIVLDRKHRPGS